MSEIKVNSIKGVGASTAALTINNTDGTCTANITNNLSNRNLIINGAMQINNHVDGNAGVHNTFAVDRFKFRRENTAANFSMTQSSTSPDGFSKSLKIDCTFADTSTASNEFVVLGHSIEAQNLQQLGYGTSGAKPLVLSFYVRSNLTGTYGFSCIQMDNSNKIYGRSYTINSANTWERKTITIPADTSGLINDDNGEGLRINFPLTMGSTYTGGSVSTAWETYSNSKYAPQHGVNLASSTSNEWLITGVQLEVDHTGTGKPTDFEHRSFGQELALCERYFQIVVDGSQSASNYFGTTFNYSTTDPYATFTYRTTMRTTPSLVQTSGSNYYYFYGNGSGQGFSSFAGLSHPGSRSTGIHATGLSIDAGGAGGFTSQNASAKVSLNAEL